MKKQILLLGLSVLALIFSGCSTKKSSLTINNNTNSALTVYVDSYPISIAPNNFYQEEYLLDKFLLFSETQTVKVKYEGYLYLAGDKKTISIDADENKVLNLNINRGGLRVRNQSGIAVSQVNLREIGSDDWSGNIIDEIMLNSEFSVPVLDKAYDMKLIDFTNREFVLNDTINFEIGESQTVIFDSFSIYYLGD